MSDLEKQQCVSKALEQVNRVSGICRFLEEPAIKTAIGESVPVTMPPGPGSLGFDAPIWMGLGVVGLWSALDAFAERAKFGGAGKCTLCGRSTCVFHRFHSSGKFTRPRTCFLMDLDDLRHLHAHNFAGHVDDEFLKRKRHLPGAFLSPPKERFSCGAQFDGRSVPLNATHLAYYCDRATELLRECH